MAVSGYVRHGFGRKPASSLAGAAGEVLPRVSRVALCDALRRLPPDELALALRRKIVPVVSLPGVFFYIACGKPALTEARRRGLGLVAYATAGDLLAAARGVHRTYLLNEAMLGLLRLWPEFSASRRLTPGQVVAGVMLLVGLAVALQWLHPAHVLAGLSVAGGLFFLAVIALRLLCLMPPGRRPPPAAAAQAFPPELPIYSVLVPLHRETAVLSQLMRALRGLRYPAEKLDIKLILEESDTPMQRAVAGLMLDDRFEVVLVPAGLPQTKPRALNYALAFCRGDYVTIYDAEDIPEPDQLLKAVRRFASAPPELACLQAQLTFYNPDENWLTRHFTAEYAALFDMVLPALSSYGLPLPLGGTSNHFRTTALPKVGAWDSFNVTEDADLGLRLARLGFETGVLDSFTHEEANTRLGNWLRQRARWLKGFLITWLVHMRAPWMLLRELGPAGFWVVQVMTLGVFLSALLHPFCLVLTIWSYAVAPPMPPDAGPAVMLAAGLSLAVLVTGYATAILLMRAALIRRGFSGWGVTLATVPVYWCLMSAAAWMALWQFVVNPFHWNKTVHGLSRRRPPSVAEQRTAVPDGLVKARREGDLRRSQTMGGKRARDVRAGAAHHKAHAAPRRLSRQPLHDIGAR